MLVVGGTSKLSPKCFLSLYTYIREYLEGMCKRVFYFRLLGRILHQLMRFGEGSASSNPSSCSTTSSLSRCTLQQSGRSSDGSASQASPATPSGHSPFPPAEDGEEAVSGQASPATPSGHSPFPPAEDGEEAVSGQASPAAASEGSMQASPAEALWCPGRTWEWNGARAVRVGIRHRPYVPRPLAQARHPEPSSEPRTVLGYGSAPPAPGASSASTICTLAAHHSWQLTGLSLQHHHC